MGDCVIQHGGVSSLLLTACCLLPAASAAVCFYKQADAAQISEFAASLRQQGRVVTEQVWQDTPHCGHYRYEEDIGGVANS